MELESQEEQWTLCLLAGGSLQLFPSQAKPMGPEHTNRTTTTPSCKSSTKNKSSQTNIDFPNNCPPMYLLVYIQGSKRVLAASHVQAFSRLAFMGLEDPSTQAQSGVVPAVNFQLFCLIHISFLFSCCGCGCGRGCGFPYLLPFIPFNQPSPGGVVHSRAAAMAATASHDVGQTQVMWPEMMTRELITKTDVSVCAECVLRQAQFPGGCGGCCPAPCAPCAGGGGGGRGGNMVTCAGLRVNEAMWLIKKIFDELQCFYHPSTGFCPA